ncbi:hypothetical protein FNF31_00020 [Cafeteria roenbergensis]|uniref:Magnesium transporter n=1 Tax=Cafeteria roenbergensis TaxID=33653 RepID=A0A5A8E3Y3_CAFRO|nr:hypothetical protein FNF31_00020 [Cafeteria roenbergensis]KAA0170611.1 hypothetical protein FNF28_01373 [Cafeteria roenbergensis]
MTLTGSQLISVIRIVSTGAVSRETWSLADVKRRSGLHSRDLVSALDFGFDAGSGQPQYRLLPRRRCIIFALSHLRGILYNNEIHLWLPQGRSADATKKAQSVEAFAELLQQQAETMHQARSALADAAERAAADAAKAAPEAAGSAAEQPAGPASPSAEPGAIAEQAAAAETVADLAEAVPQPEEQVFVDPWTTDEPSMGGPMQRADGELLAAAGAPSAPGADSVQHRSQPGRGGGRHGASAKHSAPAPPGFSGMDAPSADRAAAFEFVMLDHLLRSTHSRHSRRLAFVRPLVQNALATLDSEPDRLYTLFPLRNTLEHFRTASHDVVECLTEVLQSDRDMREACLSEKRRAFSEAFPAIADVPRVRPLPPGSPAAPRRIIRGWGPNKGTSVEAGSPTVVLERVHEDALLDLEVMLETHLRLAADVRQQAQQMLRHMDTRQAILGSTLDAYRNHLIDINLRMTIIGLGVSFGTLASGLFGMNLYNGLEEVASRGPFYAVAGACVVATVGTYYAVRDWTVLSSPAGRHAHRVGQFVSRIGLRAPRPAVSPLAAAFSGAATTAKPLVVSTSGDGISGAQHLRLTRDQFAQLYFKVTGTAIPLESVDIVYSIFDADQDGALAMDEVLGMMNEEGRIDNRALQALADADPDAADHDSQESSADRL